MASPEPTLADITSQLYAVLEPLEPDDRHKAITAVLTLLGQPSPGVGSAPHVTAGDDTSGSVASVSGNVAGLGAKRFFDEKDPRNKGEELVVAARYRELHEDAHDHSKNDFKEIVAAARRNFDDHNFTRDLNNAKIKGLFNKGPGHTVSYFGQQYVDTLPDREGLKKLRKPKARVRRKKDKVAKRKQKK